MHLKILLLRDLQNSNSFSSKVKGTKAGDKSVTFKLNCLAILYPKSVAPILGIDNPPVAITNSFE